jgi:formylglycine-generating enzyme required for sulfatase activity
MRASWLVTIPIAAAFASVACAPEPTRVTQGQVLLYFDTDAPLPAAPGDDAVPATPLFNRLRIDIYPPGSTAPCDGCSSDFDVNAGTLAQKRASIGVAPPLSASGYRARIRLFKREFVSPAGEPNADSTVDVTVLLPVVEGNAVLERTVLLATDSVGSPVGSLDAPTDPMLGPPGASLVGTWPGAARLDCKGGPPAGAVCVPGGAYWMGNPNELGFEIGSYVPEPRLIVLAPFFMASTEVTVRAYRASGLTAAGRWSGSSAGTAGQDWCTFTRAPGPFESMPLSCISQKDARAYCAAMGGDLPTEAELEYVMSGLVGDPFPWGRDAPECADAVFGRGGWGVLAPAIAPCKPSQPPGSPSPPGSGGRDRLDLPGGSIVDLAGNLAELARDLWNRIDEPCWARQGVYRDPVCTTKSPHDDLLVVYRGGDWSEPAAEMPSSRRHSLPPDFPQNAIGFRCVWPAK